MKRRGLIEQIRKAHRAQPFVPFFLRLANGREIPVRKAELMLLPPGSTMAAVYDTDDACSIIEVRHLTDLVFKKAPRKRRRA